MLSEYRINNLGFGLRHIEFAMVDYTETFLLISLSCEQRFGEQSKADLSEIVAKPKDGDPCPLPIIKARIIELQEVFRFAFGQLELRRRAGHFGGDQSDPGIVEVHELERLSAADEVLWNEVIVAYALRRAGVVQGLFDFESR